MELLFAKNGADVDGRLNKRFVFENKEMLNTYLCESCTFAKSSATFLNSIIYSYLLAILRFQSIINLDRRVLFIF